MTVFIFAGTTEGRELAELLSSKGIFCSVSAATEYGANLLPHGENLEILQGRMNACQMSEKFAEKDYDFVIDATHPFATEVSKEIKKALESTKIEYLRLSRDTGNGNYIDSDKTFFYYSSLTEAAEWLESQNGKIFVTTGSKELPVLAQKISDKERIFARVLPSRESLELCAKAGIFPKQIIAMQGPFSEKSNEVQFEESGAEFLLTKESGATGGFYEKIEAAKKLGMKIVIIKNPEKKNETTEDFHTYNIEGILQKLGLSEVQKSNRKEEIPTDPKKIIFLVGAGTGNENLLTQKAKQIFSDADVIFGAERILESLKNIISAKTQCVEIYEAEKIGKFLKNHSEFKRPAVAFSGDSGFFSGAAKFYEGKNELFADYELIVEAGISSVQYFAAKLGKSWQKWKFLSLHGSKCNSIEEIRKNASCLFILSGEDDVKSLGEKLENALENEILSSVKCYLGLNLSYDVEKIIQVRPKEMKNFSAEKKSLLILLVENENAVKQSELPLLCDEDFIRREKVPMTKKEIRQLTLCSLGLSKSSILYDIGCGTGSVTVEAARIAYEGHVFAVDCKEEAVLLTKENVNKFCLENTTCIHAEASDFLMDKKIPAPSHAFIGGSGKKLSEIVQLLLQKNPSIRIAANFVSLEGLCEMQNLIKKLEEKNKICDIEIKQISVSQSQRAGDFNLMKAQNPVWLVCFTGIAGIA